MNYARGTILDKLKPLTCILFASHHYPNSWSFTTRKGFCAEHDQVNSLHNFIPTLDHLMSLSFRKNSSIQHNRWTMGFGLGLL